jgi:hypothetical protein
MKQIPFFLWPIILMASCRESPKNSMASLPVRQIQSPAGDSAAQPYLFTDKYGTVYLSWIEKKGKEATLKFSFLTKEHWSEPVTIARGNNWFVNWADYPVIASDGNNALLAHYLEKSDTAKFAYDIKLVASADGGKTWGSSALLHDDGEKAEHGFVSIVPYNEGFFACWLDGRKTVMESKMSDHHGHHGEMTLRAAVLDKNGKKIKEWELDERVCDCCQTAAAITSLGPVVLYRDRSDDEVRDISMVRFVNGNWMAPQNIYADNWKINACPVNGPRADAIGNHLAVAWFSMADNQGEVKIVFSRDGGAKFGKPIRIDEGKPIGRVDVLMLDSATAMVSWMEGINIKAVKAHADGTKEPFFLVASSSDKRSSGFPQMTRSGNRIFFAWTDDQAKTVRVAVLNL